MIEHPTKQLNIRPRVGEGNSQQWGFPGAAQQPTNSKMPGSLLPPGQHATATSEQQDSQESQELVEQPMATSLSEVSYRSYSETSSDFYSVKVPSNFHFYDFKMLSVKKVTGRVQAKFTRAGAEENARYLVEGVSSLLGDGVSAFDLTAYDFGWLLHFILLLSYPTSPRKSVVTCRNSEHITKVDDGEMPESSLRYIMDYDRPSLDETILDTKALDALDLTSLAKYDLGVYTMRDAVDWEENYGESRKNKEDEFIYDLATYLKGGTLEERAEKVRDMSVAQFKALEAYRTVAQNHGVHAFIKSTCKECGAENVTNVTISVLDFL
jgi:hypothetical protein